MSAIVRAFSVERVREELRSRGIVFSEGLNDVLVADFPVLDHDEHNRHAPSRVRALLSAEGEARTILAVRVYSGVVFSPDDWPGLLGVVNRYNREVRAKGYVEFGSDDHDPKAKVVGEFELPLVAGVTDDQLGALVTWGIHTGTQLHRFVAAHLEGHPVPTPVPTPAELEDWMRRWS